MNRTLVITAGLLAQAGVLNGQQVRDSAGVRIVSYPVGAKPAATWTVLAKPMVEIGGADGIGSTQFSAIMGTVRLPNGTIVVANMQSNELRFFGATGKFIKSVGRTGGGPGEFAQLMGLTLVGETIQGIDFRGGPRVFNLNGGFIRQAAPATAGPMQRSFLVFPDGAALSYVQEQPSESLVFAKIFRLSADSRSSTGLIRFPTREMARGPSGRGATSVEFGAQSAMGMFTDRLCLGWSRVYEITCYHFDGRPILSIRRGVSVFPLTASARKSYDSSYTDVGGSGGSEGDHSATAATGLKALRLHNLPGLVYAKTLPVFASFLASRANEVWVRDYRIEDAFVRNSGFNPPPTTTTHWNIFASDGRWLADVTLPARFTAFDAGTDYVLGVSRDMDDVERVTMLRLVRK